jgi:hypothetical protein
VAARLEDAQALAGPLLAVILARTRGRLSSRTVPGSSVGSTTTGIPATGAIGLNFCATWSSVSSVTENVAFSLAAALAVTHRWKVFLRAVNPQPSVSQT